MSDIDPEDFFNGESTKQGGSLALMRGIQQCCIDIQNCCVRATDELSRLVIETASHRPATLKDFLRQVRGGGGVRGEGWWPRDPNHVIARRRWRRARRRRGPPPRGPRRSRRWSGAAPPSPPPRGATRRRRWRRPGRGLRGPTRGWSPEGEGGGGLPAREQRACRGGEGVLLYFI